MKGIQIRRLFVGGLQSRLVAVGMLHFAFIVCVVAAIVFLPLAIRLSFDSVYDGVVQNAARDFMVLHHYLWPALAFAFVLLVLHDILVTHRIAGPLMRMRREFDAIAEGNLNRHVEVRRGDYLHEEAASMDAMLSRLRARLEAVREVHAGAVAGLDDVQRSVEHGNSEHFDAAMASVRRNLYGAGALLDRFLQPPDNGAATTPDAASLAEEVSEPVL